MFCQFVLGYDLEKGFKRYDSVLLNLCCSCEALVVLYSLFKPCLAHFEKNTDFLVGGDLGVKVVL